MLHDLLEAGPYLSSIGAGVALLWYLGRDRDGTADEHTVDDYRPKLAPARRDWPLLDRQSDGPRRLRPDALADLEQQWREAFSRDRGKTIVLGPPLPSAPGRSVFAETAAALGVCPVDAGAVVAVVADRYGDSPADRAARMLREIAAEQRGLAVAR